MANSCAVCSLTYTAARGCWLGRELVRCGAGWFGSGLTLWEGLMGSRGLPIRGDVPAAELRRLARRERDRAAAARMYAIANALEGMSRADAARLAGMERQALRDAVVRFNAEGLAGLHKRPHPGPAPRLDAAGLSAWTLADLCREVEQRWAVRFHPGHMSKLVRSLGLSRQKARPSHPKRDPDAQAAFARRGSQARWTRSVRSIPASA